jgi:drug/metabolite transporter (DMT)-like permease
MANRDTILTPGVKMMLLATLSFSIVNVMVKYLSGVPPLEIVFFRGIFMLIFSIAILKHQKVPMWGNNKLILFLRGFFGTIGVALFFISLTRMELATAIVIHYTAPIFTTIIALIFLKERVKNIQWIFLLLSFGGVLVVKGFGNVDTIDFLIGIASAFFSGFAYNAIRRLKNSENPNVVILYFPLVTIPLMIIYYIIFPGDWKTPQGMDWLLLTGIGVFTQVAQFFMTKAYQKEPANRIAGVSYSGLLAAIFFGYTIFSEVLSFWVFIGMALVIVGVVLNLQASGKGRVRM